MPRLYQPEPEQTRDWGAAIRALLLLAFAAGVFTLVGNGNIKLYIHPRFAPYTLGAAVVLVLMALAQVAKFRATAAAGADTEPLEWARYGAFLVPLVLGLAFPPATFGANLAAKQGINLTARAGTNTNPPTAVPDLRAAPGAANARPPASAASTSLPGAPPLSSSTPADPPLSSSPPAIALQTPVSPPRPAQPSDVPKAPAPPEPPPQVTFRRQPAPPLENGRVILSATTFAPWLLEVYANSTAYVGKPVEITGFVFRPEGVASAEFVAARLVVTCHVAHAAPDGLLTLWPEGAQLQTDTWVRVEGTFEMGTFQGTDIIRIRAGRVTPVEKPADPYIYA